MSGFKVRNCSHVINIVRIRTHTCISGIVPMLPKKKNELYSGPELTEGWGLHVVERISIARVILTAFLLMVSTSIVWVALWLFWKNTQDATTVAGVVGAMSSMLLMTLVQCSL